MDGGVTPVAGWTQAFFQPDQEITMSTSVSNTTALVANVAGFIQNRTDDRVRNLNWFDDHSRCFLNLKVTFGQSVEAGETRWANVFLGLPKDDDISAFEDDDGSLHIVVPNARTRSKPLFQINAIESQKLQAERARNEQLMALLQQNGIAVPEGDMPF